MQAWLKIFTRAIYMYIALQLRYTDISGIASKSNVTTPLIKCASSKVCKEGW